MVATEPIRVPFAGNAVVTTITGAGSSGWILLHPCPRAADAMGHGTTTNASGSLRQNRQINMAPALHQSRWR
jgi:hypothetical protein